jgi:alkyldihydroxyacetonephosphate synthase
VAGWGFRLTGQVTASGSATRRRKFWGWGYEDEQPPGDELRAAAEGIRAHLAFDAEEAEFPAALEDVDLRQPRLEPPSALAQICSTDKYERAAHSYGSSYRDLIRAFRGRFDHPCDVVAFPRDERDVVALLEWCEQAGAAAIPYGGGTGVVGGVEPEVGERFKAVVTIDLGALDRVLEVDHISRAARIQAGTSGPRLQEQLKKHGFRLRHFPGSFEFSTLGGWIATRSGGHYATIHTHIDDLVESIRAVTPTGPLESRRLPGSGAGPSPDRMLLGSEGILGVITEAWVRVQEPPAFKLSEGVRFDQFAKGVEAVRALSQSGLYPSNCRLLDPELAALYGAGDKAGGAVLVLGFESAHHPVDHWMDLALECCADHGGKFSERTARSESGGATGEDRPDASWRGSFLREPYMRDTLVAAGVIAETFETAITWDRFELFHEVVMTATQQAVRSICGNGRVGWRFTHVYPDGPAPYFTVLAQARRGSELEQWDEIKAAASESIIAAGGTITHHHAVGRDHRPWYDRQRPDRFAAALAAAKSALDPGGILNPGVLIDGGTLGS